MSDTLFVPGTSYTSDWGNDANTAAYSTLAAITGTANAITATGPQQLPTRGYSQQQKFYFSPATANTGAATINISGTGAKAITKSGGTALAAGDLAVGVVAQLVYDGVEFQLLNPQTGTVAVLAEIAAAVAAIATGRLLNIQYLTASGIYTPTPGTTRVLLEGVGGGGGSSGTVATTTGTLTTGGPGSSGTWGRKWLTSGFSGTSYAIGAAGAAGGVGTVGGTGGNTTFGAVLTLPGGTGGTAAGAGASPGIISVPAAKAVAATGADISIQGQASPGVGVALSATQVYGSAGGSNPLGQGGAPVFTIAANTYASGNSGTGYGSGASGGAAGGIVAATTGFAGQPGILIVYEYS